MAKPNNFSSPVYGGSELDSVEMDRFPPRRGNPKEARRTVAILVGAVVTLAVGVGLRQTVFADRYKTPTPVSTETAEMAEVAPTPAPTAATLTSAPVPTRIRGLRGGASPAAPSANSPFASVESSPAPGTSPEAASPLGGKYDPFAPSANVTDTTPGAVSSPGAAPLPGASPKPLTPGGLESAPTTVEPPVLPSLSQTGGVYKPTLPPPPPGAVSNGLGVPAPGAGITGGAPGTTPGTLGAPAAGGAPGSPRF